MAEQKPTKRAHNFKDLTGRRFHKLLVIKWEGLRGRRISMWLCQCDCGNHKVISGTNLRTGDSTSCGCWNRKQSVAVHTKHGMAETKECKAWYQAKQRCFNSNNPGYADYGGRGISMSPEWQASFSNFYADMGPCPYGFSLDRKNVNGHYEASNCRWATVGEQSENRRNVIRFEYEGELLSLRKLSERTGIKLGTLKSRHQSGKPLLT